MRLKVGSLFAGVEGFGQGFEQAGFEVAWQVEIDKDAVSVLERHYPNVPRWRDVTEVDPADLPPVDVVTFGSPCQDMSVAGKRAGLTGERSGLFYEAVRIIAGLRPTPAFCIWENVPGTLSSAGGRDFGAVLDALAGAGALDIAWRILDARWFGVPQRRRRLFVVADLRAERAAQVLFESPSGSRHPAACGEAGQGLAGDVEDGAGVVGTLAPGAHPGGWDGHSAYNGHLLPVAAKGGNREAGPIDVATARNTHRRDDFATETFVVANSVTASAGHHGYTPDRGDGSSNLVVLSNNREVHVNEEGIAPSVRSGDSRMVIAARCQRGGNPSSNAPGRHRKDDENLVSFHLTQDPINGAESPSLGTGNQNGCATVAVQAGMAVRRLTPRECERLMGWPDDWTRYRADGSEIADGPRYRMIGNGVVAPVARWLGARLRVALEAVS